VPTPLATALGLRIGTEAQVLDHAGEPVPGLYACGNDAQSAMASEYPGAGRARSPDLSDQPWPVPACFAWASARSWVAAQLASIFSPSAVGVPGEAV
jgi:hypothetical protein